MYIYIYTTYIEGAHRQQFLIDLFICIYICKHIYIYVNIYVYMYTTYI